MFFIRLLSKYIHFLAKIGISNEINEFVIFR